MDPGPLSPERHNPESARDVPYPFAAAAYLPAQGRRSVASRAVTPVQPMKDRNLTYRGSSAGAKTAWKPRRAGAGSGSTARGPAATSKASNSR